MFNNLGTTLIGDPTENESVYILQCHVLRLNQAYFWFKTVWNCYYSTTLLLKQMIIIKKIFSPTISKLKTQDTYPTVNFVFVFTNRAKISFADSNICHDIHSFFFKFNQLIVYIDDHIDLLSFFLLQLKVYTQFIYCMIIFLTLFRTLT